MMHKQLIWILSAVLTAMLSIAIVMAQSACSAIALEALDALDNNCSNLGRNQACYGYDQVEASFLVDVDENFFTEPAQRADVADLETIRTAPLDVDSGVWGLAVMSLQANMPDTLPGQNVTFILLGDVEVENAVAPEDAFQGGETLDVTITFAAGANVRSGPGDNYNVIGGVPVGTEFTVDGISPDGGWLRTTFQDRPGWLRRTVVAPDVPVERLTTLSHDVQTPMQAFYLRTGIGEPQCNEVPDDSLLVQGPEDIEIQLTVNGANIELGSSGALRVIGGDANPQLEIAVFDGEFVIKADENNPVDVVIPAGFRSRICLGDASSRGLDGEANDLVVSCGATPPERIPSDQFNADWCNLQSIPENVLQYALSSCYGTHTVVAGENLFRIAQYYCVTIDEMVALNNLASANTIIVGQQLLIPPNACTGVGSTFPPPSALTQVAPEVTEEVATGGSCSNFALVSPLTTVDSGNQTFSWTAVNGTDIRYQLVFYSYEGREVESFFTPETSYSVNLGQQVSTGGEFSWEVRAYEGENYLCVSERSPTLTRLAVDVPPAQFTASLTSCTTTGRIATPPNTTIATVSWSNAPSTPVTITWEEGNFSMNSTTSNQTSGQVTLTEPFGFNWIKVAAGGQTINLGPC